MKRAAIAAALASLIALGGCSALGAGEANAASATTFEHINWQVAKEIMEGSDDVAVIDVRSQEEYESGHIPGAVCIPSGSIKTEAAEKLPDKDQTIIVYCRTGVRSQEAAYRLSQLGYTNVKEMGGLGQWDGEMVEGPEPGGEQKAPAVALELAIDGEAVEVEWEDNDAVKALEELAGRAPLVVEMSRYGGFEQVGPLGSTLPADDVRITTVPGDVVLYAGDQIVLFHGSNTWEYTRLGHIAGKTDEELADLLAGKDVVATISIAQGDDTAAEGNAEGRED